METIPIENRKQMTNTIKHKFNCFANIAINIRGFKQTEIDYYLYVDDIAGDYHHSLKDLSAAYEGLMAQKENPKGKPKW